MKVKTNTIVSEHDRYAEYDLRQQVIDLSIGETIEVKINGVTIIDYTAKYINAHTNIIIQDKGEKRESIA